MSLWHCPLTCNNHTNKIHELSYIHTNIYCTHTQTYTYNYFSFFHPFFSLSHLISLFIFLFFLLILYFLRYINTYKPTRTQNPQKPVCMSLFFTCTNYFSVYLVISFIFNAFLNSLLGLFKNKNNNCFLLKNPQTILTRSTFFRFFLNEIFEIIVKRKKPKYKIKC